MLTNDFPVHHKTNKDYGLGVAIGSQVLGMPNENNEMIYGAYILILWENADSPSLHPANELAHQIDVQQYFSDDEEEEEEEEEEDNLELFLDSENHDESIIPEVETITPDDVGNVAEVLDFKPSDSQPTT